jgi:ribonuclease BN (tRNA processing enzyme)
LTVQVTFIGSGDAFGSGGRLQACILVDNGGERLLLDCGTTSLVGLKRAAIDPNGVGAVVVSHLHADHFGGIPFLVLDGQFSRRERDLVIAGPVGTRQRLLDAMEVLYPGSSRVQRRFEVRVLELEPGRREHLGNGPEVSTFLADHASGAPAHVTRLHVGGKVIAYSGDTAWTPALVEAAHEADVFICESYFRERRVPYHLSYAELLENRGRFDARIVLTHMTSEMIDAQDIDFERAFDGMNLEL